MLNIENLCSQIDCNNVSSKKCSACERVSYCSVSCQKQHWRVNHKDRCLKKLPTEYVPLAEVLSTLTALSEQLQRLVELGSNNCDQILCLRHSIAFAEFQLCVPSDPEQYYYCTRPDGLKIDNFTVAHAMSSQYLNLATRYSNGQSLVGAQQAEPYFRKSRGILEPLRLLLDVIVDDEELRSLRGDRELILGQLSRTERKLAVNCMELNRFRESDAHCSQSLYFAKQMEVNEGSTTTVQIEALLCYGVLREHQYWADCAKNSKGAYEYFEEAYLLASEAYDPVHPQVQDVSAYLIGCLIKLGDFIEAERFARINYESLTCANSGADPNGREVMKGASMLVKICYLTAQQTNKPLVGLEEGEKLSRKVMQIAMETDGVDGYDSGIYQYDLYLVLKEKDRLRFNSGLTQAQTELEARKSIVERKILLDRALAISVRCHANGGKDTMYMHMELYHFYGQLSGSSFYGKEKERAEALRASRTYLDSALRTSIVVNGLRHPFTFSLIKFSTVQELFALFASVYPGEFSALLISITIFTCSIIRTLF